MSTLVQEQKKETPTAASTHLATTHGLLQRKCACGGTPGVDGECEECREKLLSMQRRATTPASPPTVPPIVHDVLSSPGQSLDAGTRVFMEPRFGHDFSNVRVHTDAKAAESARAVNALAYTVGREVVFGTGQYTLQTSEGKRLLAHELTHVVQQRNGLSLQQKLEIRPTNDHYEQEADQVSRQVMEGSFIAVPSPITTGSIQRKIGDKHDLDATRFAGNAILEDVYDGKGLLQKGDSGVAVRLIQQSLLAQGYALPVYGADSKFGSETEKAIQAFQIDTGAKKLDGIVGPETMQLLNMHDPGATKATGPTASAKAAATGAVFSESPNEKFAGYDSSVAPSWLIVPVSGRREAKVTATPAAARPSFVSINTAVATVTTTPNGIAVTGVTAGTTDIEARQGATVLSRLKISIKTRRDISTAFRYVCDSAAPIHHCTSGTPAESPHTLSLLNRVWERQANVRFTHAGSGNVAVPGDLGPAVDWTSPTGGEWNTVTATSMGASYNIFRVWRYMQDGTWPNDAANKDVNTLIGDHPCADGLGAAHETGHFLGLDHPDSFIMNPCGTRTDQRVSKAEADKVNP